MQIISLTTAKVAEQTDNHYSELTRSCTAEWEPDEENGPMKLEDNVQQEDDMKKECYDEVNFFLININCSVLT